MDFLVNQLLVRRYLLSLLTIALSGAVSWGIFSTSVDNTFNGILSEDDPYREEVSQVREDFPPSTAVLFAFLDEGGSGVFKLDTLRAMEDLTARYVEVEAAISVASLTNYRLNAVDAEEHDRDYLLPQVSALSDEDLAAIRIIALADEDLTKSLLSPAGDLALGLVRYKAPSDDKDTRMSIAESVVTLRDSLRADYPGLTIYVIGNVLFELDSYKAQIKDSRYLAPFVMTISILLLWFCLKSLPFSLCVMSVSFITIALTVGTAGWIQMPFNQISAMGPLVVLMIATADCVHIVSIYVQGLHRSLSKLEAMRHSLAINFQPVSLATVTTAFGFLSLNYCSSPGIYGFGNVVAIGVFWAYLVTFTFLPTLILLLPIHKIPKPLGVRGFITGVEQLVTTRGTLLFRGCLVLIVATLALLPLNTVDFNRFSFVDKDSDFHHAMTALSEKIGNDQSLVYSVHSGEYYGITTPGFCSRWMNFPAGWKHSRKPVLSPVTRAT